MIILVFTAFLSAISLFFVFKDKVRKWIKGGQCNIKKDLTGKIAIITGSNTGIGFENAKALIEMNCTVILACRDIERGKKAQKLLEQQTNKSENIKFMRLDLADLTQIDQFVEEFNKNFQQLDILVNNAGVMMINGRQLTKQGFEMQVGVNHIGHTYLYQKLAPILEKTAQKTSSEVRVITVSSVAHMQNLGKINWTNYLAEKSYDKKTQYANSKLSNIYFTKYLALKQEEQQGEQQEEKNNNNNENQQQNGKNQEQNIENNNNNFSKKNIYFFSLHPGVVDTEIIRHISEYKIIKFLFSLSLIQIAWNFCTKTPKDGAQTQIYLCLENVEKLKNGAYYSDCKEKQLYQFAQNQDEIEKCWKVTQSLINSAVGKSK